MVWNENNIMKKILICAWFSSMLVACGSVSPVSPTPLPTRSATITPVVTSVQSQATVTIVIPYTSTPSEVCPSYGSNGPSVYLDEMPVFAIRQGPGCEYESAPPRIIKDDPLAFFDILEKRGDWLLVDFCNDKQGWVFAPAIDDINIHLNMDDFSAIPGISPTKPAHLTERSSLDQARDTLISFFDLMHNKNYEEAAEIFSGGYGIILMWNPDIDTQDHPSLLRTACEYDDFQCSLRVSQIIKEEQISPMEYYFTVELIKKDGSVYQRPNNNGEIISQFVFRVVKDCNEKYFVVDWPFYGF
jgi:hypothetical protein